MDSAPSWFAALAAASYAVAAWRWPKDPQSQGRNPALPFAACAVVSAAVSVAWAATAGALAQSPEAVLLVAGAASGLLGLVLHALGHSGRAVSLALGWAGVAAAVGAGVEAPSQAHAQPAARMGLLLASAAQLTAAGVAGAWALWRLLDRPTAFATPAALALAVAGAAWSAPWPAPVRSAPYVAYVDTAEGSTRGIARFDMRLQDDPVTYSRAVVGRSSHSGLRKAQELGGAALLAGAAGALLLRWLPGVVGRLAGTGALLAAVLLPLGALLFGVWAQAFGLALDPSPAALEAWFGADVAHSVDPPASLVAARWIGDPTALHTGWGSFSPGGAVLWLFGALGVFAAALGLRRVLRPSAPGEPRVVGARSESLLWAMCLAATTAATIGGVVWLEWQAGAPWGLDPRLWLRLGALGLFAAAMGASSALPEAETTSSWLTLAAAVVSILAVVGPEAGLVWVSAVPA